jgi:hypothetical protein
MNAPRTSPLLKRLIGELLLNDSVYSEEETDKICEVLQTLFIEKKLIAFAKTDIIDMKTRSAREEELKGDVPDKCNTKYNTDISESNYDSTQDKIKLAK